MKKEKFKVRTAKKVVTAIAKVALPLVGWRCRENDHTMWYCPCKKHMVLIAGTPGDRRAHRRNVARLRKCETTRNLILKG
jgi:hypothetical protein